jgi:hypothetical protein
MTYRLLAETFCQPGVFDTSAAIQVYNYILVAKFLIIFLIILLTVA